MYRRIKAFTTRRDLTIAGTPVAAGTTLTLAQVKAIPRLDALVANGSIEAVPDVYGRRGVHGPKPAFVQPGLRTTLVVTAWQDPSDGLTWNFACDGGTTAETSYVFDYGDESPAVVDADGAVAHQYAEAGTYEVSVAYGYQLATIDVVVTELAAVVDGEDSLTYAFTITPAGQGPWTFDFGDESALVVDADGALEHTFAEAGTYTVVATNATQYATVEVVVAGA